jgi:N-acetylglucosaminyldiphosphoundecaprenol N-acetyl-beta-D-mannosaminyltransferase
MKTNSLKDDLSREVWCLMGLPIDAVSMSQTVEKIDSAIRERKQLFLTTPNLNFVIGCRSDEKFRNSVIQSDLVIADGMPLIWVAKLLNIPIRERVSGSNLFEILLQRNSIGREYRIFYFGGQDDVAKRAEEKTANLSSVAVGAGSISPGFVSTTEMSKSDYIEKINRSESDILIVALGAKKGQEWIVKNLQYIDTPIVSHLGAVINFIAGTIKRSPVWMQKTGLEWLWRIKEEKSLFERYWNDGVAFIEILATNVFPQMIQKNNQTGQLTLHKDHNKLIITGYFTASNIDSEIEKIIKLVDQPFLTSIDLSECQKIDQRGLGLLLMLKKHIPNIYVINPNSEIEKVFVRNGVEYLLDSI